MPQKVLVSTLMLILLVVFILHAQEAEVLTNESVLALHQLGFSSEVLLEKIRFSHAVFDLDLESLKRLKEAGVGDEIISEMLRKSAVSSVSATDLADEASDHGDSELLPKDPGIYLLESADGGGRRFTKLKPSRFAQVKGKGMIKSALTFGIGKMKMRVVLPGAKSDNRVAEDEPTFYFRFAEGEGGFSAASGPTSPRDFALAELTTSSRKGSTSRELVVGTANVFAVKEGVLEETVRGFDYDEVEADLYKVTPRASMQRGEYCFMFTGAKEGDPIWDFSVDF